MLSICSRIELNASRIGFVPFTMDSINALIMDPNISNEGLILSIMTFPTISPAFAIGKALALIGTNTNNITSMNVVTTKFLNTIMSMSQLLYFNSDNNI